MALDIEHLLPPILLESSSIAILLPPLNVLATKRFEVIQRVRVLVDLSLYLAAQLALALLKLSLTEQNLSYLVYFAIKACVSHEVLQMSLHCKIGLRVGVSKIRVTPPGTMTQASIHWSL